MFFIGIDANPRPLEKISEKIYRKAAKGGLPNVLFAQSAVETLPSELNGIASEIHVNLPWGSLLRAVVAGDETILKHLRRACSPAARLKVMVSLDLAKDGAEMGRLGVPHLSLAYVDQMLKQEYRNAGFEIAAMRQLNSSSLADLETSWAKRLRQNANRSFIEIIARAL